MKPLRFVTWLLAFALYAVQCYTPSYCQQQIPPKGGQTPQIRPPEYAHLSAKDYELVKGVILGDAKRVKSALEKGANPNLKDDMPLVFRSAMNHNVKVTQLLLRYGADPNACEPLGRKSTLFVSCCPSSKYWDEAYTVAKSLLDAGAKVNAADKLGWTPLMCAVARGNVHIVQLLLAHKADKRMRDASGKTALDHALGKTSDANLKAGREAAYKILKEANPAKLHK